jgi:hypothetical protein
VRLLLAAWVGFSLVVAVLGPRRFNVILAWVRGARKRDSRVPGIPV